jgi:hypothetical protein
MAAPTVLQFVTQSYRLISANNPTVPLHGNDFEQGILLLNQLLESYASTGLLLTIAKEVRIPLTIGQQFVTVGPADYLPTPNITLGRLANLDSAWLFLDGVTYPLITKSRDEFLASYKYAPLKGLPRFIISYPDTDIVNLQLYPAPSQFFEFNLRGKFQLTDLTSANDMSGLPGYYVRFLQFALAKDMAMYKGRAAAWTPQLEEMLIAAQDKMEAASEVNLTITGDRASLLNGSWRVRAGI